MDILTPAETALFMQVTDPSSLDGWPVWAMRGERECRPTQWDRFGIWGHTPGHADDLIERIREVR